MLGRGVVTPYDLAENFLLCLSACITDQMYADIYPYPMHGNNFDTVLREKVNVLESPPPPPLQ